MRFLVLLMSVLLLNQSCIFSRQTPDNGGDRFELSIVQDGLVKNIDAGGVILERRPFDIVFKFSGPGNVYVNATFSPLVFDGFESGETAAGNPLTDPAVLDDTPFNKSELLLISEGLHNFWQYRSDEDNSFNKVEKTGSSLYCYRTVSRISKPAAANRLKNPPEVIFLSAVKEDIVYLTAVKQDWNEDYSAIVEKQRLSLKIFFKEKINEL